MYSRVIIFTFIAFLLIPSKICKAQIFGGVRSGINFSKVATDAPDENDIFKAGYTGGIFGAFPVDMDKRLLANIELNYANKGMKTRIEGNKAFHSIHYFEMPIFLRGIVYSKDKKGFKAFINGGPYIAGRLGAKTVNNIKDFPERSIRYQKDNTFRGFDTGLGIGAGAIYPIGDGYLTGEIRYSFGFINLNDQFLNRNRVINFSVSYFLDIEKLGIDYKDWVIFPQKDSKNN